MENIVCSGFGHRDLHYNQAEIEEIIEILITEKNVTTFYTGGMGNFDSAFSSAVRKIKRKHSNIKLCWVIPYLTKELEKNKDYYNTLFDEIFIPNISTYYKSAITIRNRWMVEQSQYILSGIIKTFGGAYDALKYAERINKIVISLKEDNNKLS